MCFSDDEPDSMKTSFLRQRYQRKTINDKWDLKELVRIIVTLWILIEDMYGLI